LINIEVYKSSSKLITSSSRVLWNGHPGIQILIPTFENGFCFNDCNEGYEAEFLIKGF